MPRRDPNLPRLLLAAAFIGAIAALIWAVRTGTSPAKSNAPSATNDPSTSRIVALSPALAITLRDLGVADRIVGRHGFDLALDKSIPVCGDQSGIDYEALIRVRPTDILMERGAAESPPRLRELAAKNGWQLRDYPLVTIDDVLDSTLKLGLLFAQTDETLIHGSNGARTLHPTPAQAAFANLVQRMKAAWLEKHPPPNAGRILLLESIDPPAALGPGSFHHQILERIGGTPAITTGKPYMTLDTEDILRLAPDGIILFAPRSPGTNPGPAPSADELRTRLGRIGALDIPAIRNTHTALIDDPFCLTPSTALLNVSEEMERILKHWRVEP